MGMSNNFLALTLQLSVPIILGALCGTIAERGGVVMLGVEGMMLIGSFAGAVGSYFTGSALAGAVISVVLGAVMGWIYGLFSNTPGDYIKKPMRDCTGTNALVFEMGVEG